MEYNSERDLGLRVLLSNSIPLFLCDFTVFNDICKILSYLRILLTFHQ